MRCDVGFLFGVIFTAKALNLEGKRFGRLTVLSFAGSENRKRKWNCVCDCGNYTTVGAYQLTSGYTQSCGCLQKEIIKKVRRKHGKYNTRIYQTWKNIRSRCKNKSFKYYKNYGGRGIKVCDEWNNSFEAFYKWAMENGYRDDLTIDRIDVNGNYEPSNCRWVTWDEQARNKRDTNYIEYNGERKILADWAKIFGISKNTLRNRIVVCGWSIEDALNTPIYGKYGDFKKLKEQNVSDVIDNNNV